MLYRIFAPVVLLVIVSSPASADAISVRPNTFVEGNLPGNTSTPIPLRLCDPEAASINSQYPHYYHFTFAGNAGWTGGHYSPIGGVFAGDTTFMAPATQCQDTTVYATGVSAAATYYTFISTCYDMRANAGGELTCTPFAQYNFLYPITSTISLSTNRITIGPTQQSTAVSATLNPPVTTLTVTPNCVVQNGATVTVAPATAQGNVTDVSGKAYFTVQSSVVNPTAGQTPSGNCQFSITADTNTANLVFAGAPFTPVLQALPNVITQMNGTTAVSVRTQTSPAYANLKIDGTCQSSIVNTTMATSAFTNSAGDASFTVATSLTHPIPGQTPSGTCTFHLDSNSAYSSSLTIQGTVYQPSLTVTSTGPDLNGHTAVTAQVFPTGQGVQIDAACQTQLATATVDNASQLTDSAGTVHFAVTTSNLVIVDPVPSHVPTASCTFGVHGGTASNQITFLTGNACAYGLQPLPPGCGNPTP